MVIEYFLFRMNKIYKPEKIRKETIFSFYKLKKGWNINLFKIHQLIK